MTNKIAWEPWEDKPITEIPQFEENTKEEIQEQTQEETQTHYMIRH